MKKVLFAGAAIAAAVAAAPASAQDAEADFYIGAQAGFHNLGDNPIGDDSGALFGGYAGVDFGERVVFGIEGNFNAGSGLIDSEYGIAGKLGMRVGNAGQLFVRGGYQEVDVDLNALVNDLTQADLDVFFGPGVVDLDDLNAVDINALGVDDKIGGFLVGVGGQFMVSENVSLRATVDTIEFDTVRATGGLAFHF